ncbi:MAG TPA: VCBS repeat-containing protein, partial [Terracidiphilus sp.]|nr:VCBS repeat-containing protein [Terracidiphilus sp.]
MKRALMNVLRSLAAASVWALGCGSAVFMHTAPVASAAPVPTTTTLAVTSGGNAVTSAGSGTAITLTATVMASGAAVKVGQVVFCDMAASHCSSIDSIGEAQLTSAGTATIRLVPGVGNHSFEAAFFGTTNDLSSSSAASALSVTGDHSTTTSISESGSSGSYSLTATVVGYADKTPPTGTVSFLDASNGNALLASATAGSGTAGLAWLNASNPATEGYPQSIATGDFNNDGIPDLAVANSGSGTVNILLGNGDGTFRQANNSPVTVGEYPWSIAVGDFNGDGNTDLAVANYGSSSVSILLGNGDGTFAPGPDSPISLPGAPGTIVTSDFNDDGIADLAVLAPAPNGTVTILLGFGNGAFAQAPGNPLSIAYAYSLAATDFNSDGIPDLIVLSTIGTATIQLGNGNGTFTQSGSAFSIGNSPDAVAVGDFNGDGISDLAIIDWGGNAVRILLGKGNAKFSEGPPIAVGNEPSSIAIGDFNGDGFEDLAISNEEDQTVTILLGSGNGTFTQASASPVKQAGTPVSIVAADLNGDGFWDFAVADQDNSVAVAELSQLTETVTATSSGISVSGSPSSHSVVANYSGDGNYASSTSFATALRAQPLTPTVAVTPSAATISTIDPLTVTIDVSGGNGNPVPAGSVQLSGGGYTSAAAALSSGIATINVPAGVLATGADTFTAAYAPDAASSPTYSSSSGTTSIWVGGPSAATPVVTVSPLPANIAANQSMTVNISVAGGSGNPVPTGLVTVMSNNPAAQIYDTFQYPDGTLINGKTAQSGNSVWSIGSDGIGVVEDMHLANAAPNVEGGVMYATLANTITVGGAPQPVTTIGGTIRLCPSDSGTYTSYPSVGMIATHDPSFKSFIEIGFGPSSWWADKNVNGAGTHTIASGSENLLVDCTTEYTVQMIINQAAGTYQIIPPDGIPSAVNNDPDITT